MVCEVDAAPDGGIAGRAVYPLVGVRPSFHAVQQLLHTALCTFGLFYCVLLPASGMWMFYPNPGVVVVEVVAYSWSKWVLAKTL